MNYGEGLLIRSLERVTDYAKRFEVQDFDQHIK